MSATREGTIAVHAHSLIPAERHCMPLAGSQKDGLRCCPEGWDPGRTLLGSRCKGTNTDAVDAYTYPTDDLVTAQFGPRRD